MKAIALISGGLDSILAAKIMQNLGIEIIPLHFKIPFCGKPKKDPFSSPSFASIAANYLNSKLEIIEPKESFLEVIKNPKHGFGSQMNPCIDCKIFMLQRAKELLDKWGASFVITGEVLGQRPMSQHRKALKIIEQSSGLEGLLLRPLCAKLLDQTIPEKEGWIEREKLLRFNGRTRRPQMELAKELGIKNYANPAGGCLLTDAEFSKRLKDLMQHEGLKIEDIELLKFARHFRLSQEGKLIVGRNKNENDSLREFFREEDLLFYPKDIAGPTSLGRRGFDEGLIEIAAKITCRYCDLNSNPYADIIIKSFQGKEICLKVEPLDENTMKRLHI